MEPGIELRTHQIADLAFYMREPKCMNLSDPGTGKTPSVCVMQWVRWDMERACTCWLMPKRLLRKNLLELLRFTDFLPHQVAILDGPPAEIKRILEDERIVVLLMGFDRHSRSWRSIPKRFVAIDVDEMNMGYKTATSARTQNLFKHMDSGIKWFIGMTGTLVDGKLTSVYPAIRMIDQRYYMSEKAFEAQHAILDWDNKIIGWKNHEKIARILGRHGIRRTFKDVYGEQEIVFQPRVVEMSPKQRTMYDKFEKNAILELDRFYLDGTQPGVGFIRARQLMEHPNEFPDLTSEDKVFVDVMPGQTPGKEDLLDIDLEDHLNNGKPLLIFSAMVPQQRRIAAILKEKGFRYGLINGSTPQKVSEQLDLDFQAGKVQVLVCSPQCASVGFNWQFCGKQEVDHMIFMSFDYRDTVFLQAVQRAVRGKRTSPLRVSLYEYENSVDQHILGIVHKKSVDANKVDPTRPVLQLSGYNRDYKAAA